MQEKGQNTFHQELLNLINQHSFVKNHKNYPFIIKTGHNILRQNKNQKSKNKTLCSSYLALKFLYFGLVNLVFKIQEKRGKGREEGDGDERSRSFIFGARPNNKANFVNLNKKKKFPS